MTSARTNPHELESDYVRDQLVARTLDLNGKRYRSEGEFVLYWMQSTHRLDENWGLRAAIRTADRLNLPVVVHQGLDPTYLHASDRHHTTILQGAIDTARQAESLGIHYQFVLRRRRDDDRRVVDRLAEHAYLVFTDLYPTAGIRERSQRFADRCSCRVLAIDSVCTVPSGSFATAEYAARTIRPKLAALLAASIEPIADHAPRASVSAALRERLRELTREAPLTLSRFTDVDITREVSSCEIDHDVRAVTMRGGQVAAQARWRAFLENDLPQYAERRQEAGDADGTSGLSPYLHYGHISSARVVREALESGAPSESLDPFVQQITTWRELSYNWCVRTPAFDALTSLPAWIQRTMDEHVKDPRPVLYDLATLEAAETGDELWNAAQRQLVRTGVIHNYPRMLWAKTVLLWTRDYEEARTWLFHLNDKYATDGRDANSVGGIMWCLGLWDRPWGNKPIWGGIRPMVTSRARFKFDVDRYISQYPRHPTQ